MNIAGWEELHAPNDSNFGYTTKQKFYHPNYSLLGTEPKDGSNARCLPAAATATAQQACLCFLHLGSFVFVPSPLPSPPLPPARVIPGTKFARAEPSWAWPIVGANGGAPFLGPWAPLPVKTKSLLGFRFYLQVSKPESAALKTFHEIPKQTIITNNYYWGQNLSHLIGPSPIFLEHSVLPNMEAWTHRCLIPSPK